MSMWSHNSVVPPEQCCKYNRFVSCGTPYKNDKGDRSECSRCGWNPKEHDRRLAALYGNE